MCPVCHDKFLDNTVLNFPRGENRNLVHRDCFIGFLALHRACRQGGGDDAADEQTRAKARKNKKKARTPQWPETGSSECEEWLRKHLPPALYDAPSPVIKKWGSLEIGTLILFVSVLISYMTATAVPDV